MPLKDSLRKTTRASRKNTLLVFDPEQKVPASVLHAIVNEWLVPTIVEQFLVDQHIRERSPAVGSLPLLEESRSKQPD
jgi:hypothetical protein